MSNLAAALANAKLKKTPGKEEKETPSAQTGNSNGTSTAGSSGGMASMMDEMAKTLARRRAQTDGTHIKSDTAGDDARKWDKHAVNGSSPCKDADQPNGRFVKYF